MDQPKHSVPAQPLCSIPGVPKISHRVQSSHIRCIILVQGVAFRDRWEGKCPSTLTGLLMVGRDWRGGRKTHLDSISEAQVVFFLSLTYFAASPDC